MQADLFADDEEQCTRSTAAGTTSPDAVTLIDAHHHLWDLSQRKHPNLIGEPRHDFFMGDDSAIRRDYLPEDYRRDAAGHNVLTTCIARPNGTARSGSARRAGSPHPSALWLSCGSSRMPGSDREDAEA